MIFPRVSIVILNYNGRDVLLGCLASVLKNKYPNFKVIVVDNASKDGSLEAAKKKFPELCYLKNEKNIGFSAGNNVGIRKALAQNSDYVLLLNNDTLVDKNFLLRLMEAAQVSPEVGLVCPLIFEGESERVWFSGARLNWLRMRTVHLKENIKKARLSEIMTGCAMLIKREVIEKVGYLDEDYFLYWEDTDFSWRAGRAGFSLVVAPKSHVYHFENSNSLNPEKIYHLVKSGLIFFKKNTPSIFRLWIDFFIVIRKLKNKINRMLKKPEAEMVNKAYLDFYAGK